MAVDDQRLAASETGETSPVDLTLIDEMLRLSPRQRLEQNDRMATLAASLRAAFVAGSTAWPNRER